jgi:hypothetical protein
MLVSFNSNTTGITSGAGIANLSGNLSSAQDFSGVRVFLSLFFLQCFVDRCFSFCYFSFDHCIVCPFSVYVFCMFWILITPLIYSIFSLSFKGPKTTTPNVLLDIGHWELLVFGNSCKSSFTCRE